MLSAVLLPLCLFVFAVRFTYPPCVAQLASWPRDTPAAATSPRTPPCHKHYVALPHRVTPASMYFASHQRFAHTRPYRISLVCHKRVRLFLETPGRWHRAYFKVNPVQRTLGKFYRPASITRVPHSSGPRFACPRKV